jgi:curli biogenesis system outer membrane secretion channel CsgG
LDRAQTEDVEGTPVEAPMKVMTVSRLTRRFGGFALCAALAAWSGTPSALAMQQEAAEAPASTEPPSPSKLGIAVPTVKALPAVVEKVAGYGQANELAQIVQGLDAKLTDALQQTRKFEVRAHSELAKILGEQGAQDSGNYDLSDPNRAKPFKLAGIPYLALVQIDDFQDQVQTASFEGVGQKATRRQIRLSAVCRIFDTTKATLLESARLTISDFDFKNNPQYVVEQKGGDLTEAVVNVIADKMASKVAQKITDTIFPAKVLVVRDGVVTLNRGEGTDIAVGEIWEVSAPGELLVDPETGENLGFEEVPVGFVRVVSIAPKFSRASVCGMDRGVAKGCILRKTSRTSCDDGQAPKMYMPVLPQDSGDAAPPLRGPGRVQGDGPAVPPVPVATPVAPQVGSTQPRAADAQRPTAAIFVRNRDKDIEDSHVMALEDYLVAELDGACFTTISREDVEIAVAKFAGEGANAGTGAIDPVKDLDKLLSDNASALSLAQSMGADYVLVASLTDLSIDRRGLTDPARGVKSEVESFRLDVTYRILGRAEGRVVASGPAGANDSVRQTPELKVEREVVSDLVRTSAAKLAAAMKKRCEKTALPAPDALVRIPLEIQATTSDFAVPEIVKDDKGQWTISAGRFRLEPSEFLVKIDGRLVGSTPAPIEVVKGLRKIEVSRPDYETYSATINVQPGIGAIKIPMKMTDAGLARVAEMTAFFQGLKQGQQLTDAQVKVLEGYAEFFRNSKFSIDQKTDVKVDTDQAPVFENNSFWSGVTWVR